MGKKSGSELRDAAGKPRRQTAKVSARERRFLQQWRSGLSKASTLWEGPYAVDELLRKGLLDFARCEGKWKEDWRAHDLLERICAQVKRHQENSAYWKQCNKPAKHAVRIEVEYLRKLEKNLKQREENRKIFELSYQLKRLRREVFESRRVLQRFLPPEAKKPFWVSPLGAWETLWPKQRYKRFAKREIELDSMLQLQLGKMLGVYLRGEHEGVSLMTLSRLIVLVYWASDLAEPSAGQDNQLRIKSTDRVLSVRKVHTNLIEAGVDRAKAFSRKQRRSSKSKVNLL